VARFDTPDETRNPWVLRTSTPVYDNAWIRVRHDEVIDPSGRDGVYGVISPKNWALGVLAFFDDARTLLVGQYRYAGNRYSWEIPEGGGPFDIPLEESISRELREETGYAADSWHKLYSDATLSNSVTDERVHIWLAWDLAAGTAEPESTEDLAIRHVPFSEVVEMVWDGTIHDCMTVMAVARTEAMRLRGELPPRLAQILG
jgi:8-oxo-dGTP pyrophosphatase MutT (NUDIX family)